MSSAVEGIVGTAELVKQGIVPGIAVAATAVAGNQGLTLADTGVADTAVARTGVVDTAVARTGVVED